MRCAVAFSVSYSFRLSVEVAIRLGRQIKGRAPDWSRYIVVLLELTTPAQIGYRCGTGLVDELEKVCT
jgi:hypothetical protein